MPLAQSCTTAGLTETFVKVHGTCRAERHLDRAAQQLGRRDLCEGCVPVCESRGDPNLQRAGREGGAAGGGGDRLSAQ
ncbi:unnamed protein product [Closterium sp. NIES-53]